MSNTSDKKEMENFFGDKCGIVVKIKKEIALYLVFQDQA